MACARGHKKEWDFFASESGVLAWNSESALSVYRRIEDWQGAPDPTRRGAGEGDALLPIGGPERL